MRTIWKYELEIKDYQEIEIPLAGHGIVHAGVDPNGRLCLWAEVEPNRESKYNCKIAVIGTGHPVPPDHGHYDYVGSVLQSPFMWHIFVRLD